jgi:pimeloyl-ACP methyl ester carboxylesterase
MSEPTDAMTADEKTEAARRRLAAVSTALSGFRSGLLVARPVMDQVSAWQSWGTKFGLGIARTVTGGALTAPLNLAESIALWGISAVNTIAGGSIDAASSAVKLIGDQLPHSEEDRLLSKMSIMGLLEAVLEVRGAADDVVLVNSEGVLGPVGTVLKLWAWMRVLQHTEAAWINSVEGSMTRLGGIQLSSHATEPAREPKQELADLEIVPGPPVEGSSGTAVMPGENYDVVVGTLASSGPAERHLFELLASTDPADWPAQLLHLRRLIRLCTVSYGESLEKFLGLSSETPATRPSAGEGSTEHPHPSHAFFASRGDLPPDSEILHSTHTLRTLTSLGIYHPLLFILRDPSTKSIVVVIRGTLSFSDILCDLAATPTTHGSGHMHSAFLAAAKMLVLENAPFMVNLQKALAENPGFGILITGHSLGAALASALALLLPPLFAGVPAHAVAFASPAVASRLVVSKNVTSIVLGDDPVPRLSIETVRYAKHAVNAVERLGCAGEIVQRDSAVAKLNEELKQLDQRAAGGESGQQAQRDSISALLSSHRAYFLQLRHDLEGSMLSLNPQRLLPLGRTILLSPDGSAFDLERPEEVLRGMLVTGESLRDHMPDRYLRALERVD